ncbi:MAG: DUF3570 domain-containing protein [Myxococcota bacterium]|nr:DUF3570 domain-containing protein [Myxococcota bacterium]
MATDARACALLALAVLSIPARASSQDRPPEPDTDDDALPAELTSLEVERFEARFAAFVQRGRGWQSQASPDARARGSEALEVYQPILFTRLREGRDTTHEITIPVDVVSAASPDALDAVSTASLVNESAMLDVRHRFALDADTRVALHWGGSIEEALRSGTLGLSIARELADDNAVLVVSADVIGDHLDRIRPNGSTPDTSLRIAATLNVALSQLLSPTTIAELSAGATFQAGELATTWNSIPTATGARIGDRLPESRARYALRALLRQAVPETRTFGEVSYRFYADDFGVVSHTAELALTQDLVPETLWLRASGRVHAQDAPWLWTALAPDDPPAFRTADSDLAELVSLEVGASLRWTYDRGETGGAARASWIELEVDHYTRTNDLAVTVIALGWGQAF